ncbi:site-specific integrase [Sphingobacterium lactis]|uniref:Site-specific recombinase XerD n=1 Tax=Sphingobacterium lactis TaxID=797291 RepID=A0A1H6BRK8_9SPHI|nr:site-specific integrase [Sphingobacterium lactis]SEG63105.1 Site-specific recombinase XerD [Sphingobacterium lactis]
MGIVNNEPGTMFKFSTKLHVHKHRVKKNGYVAINIQVNISTPGNLDRDYFPLSLDWPLELIDFDQSILNPRFKGDSDANDFNMIIMSERSRINEIAKIYRLSGRYLNTDILKRELFYFDTSKSVIGYFIKRRRELMRLKVISEQTWKNYGSTIKALEEFNQNLRWDQVSVKFMFEFRSWLKKRRKANGNLISHNTVWTRIKDIKALFGNAKDEIQVFVPQDVIDFPNPYVESESTYLNKEEIVRLIQQMDADVLNPTQFNVLKAFLFCCFSGIRISDLYNSKYSWMFSDNFMKFTMQKNSERKPKTITIPLIPIAKVFIYGTNGNLFELPTMQEYNRSLKDLAGFAKIDKVITSHVARHTFGYLIMKYVGDIYLLKKLLGHSKIATTEKYAHVDDEDNYEKTLQIQGDFEGLWKMKNV